MVYGFIAIDTLDKLTIEAGTKVHFDNSGGMWVYRGGTLKVEGTKEKPVIFRGDRLEPGLEDLPGQWDRIWINEGAINEINYAIIQNAFVGIQAEALFLNGNPTQLGNLSLKNTIMPLFKAEEIGDLIIALLQITPAVQAEKLRLYLSKTTTPLVLLFL